MVDWLSIHMSICPLVHIIQHPICTLYFMMARFTGFMNLIFSQLSVCVILLIIGGIYGSMFEKSAVVHAHKVLPTPQTILLLAVGSDRELYHPVSNCES